MFDSYNRLTGTGAINPAAARTTSTNGTAIDLNATNDGNNTAAFFVIAGTITDGTHAFKLQDSTDGGSTWNDVASPYIQGSGQQFTSATTAGTVIKLGYLGNPSPSATNSTKVRLVCTVTGSPATGGIYAAVCVLGGGALLPAA
jgi:hypothetical protein